MCWTRIVRACLAVALSFVVCQAHAAPEVGWYWNASESGRGFFIESKGGIIYFAGYFYESDGRATWLVSGGANADPYTYRGRLLQYSGGQTLFGSYRPPSAPTDVGEISLQFSDDRHATLTWPGGTIALERQAFDARVADLQPDSGWWWSPAESGRGYSIEVQGGSLFFVGFMYDASGNPVWYFSAGPMATETHYDGAILRFANGQTMGGAYRAPSSAPVGRLILDFETRTSAQMTFTSAPSSGSALGSRARSVAAGAANVHIAEEDELPPLPLPPKKIEREFRYPQPYDPPRGFSGHFSLDLKTHDVDDLGGVVDNKILVDVENVQFERKPVATAPYEVYYEFTGASGADVLKIHIDHKQNKADGGHCEGTFDQRYPMAPGAGSFTLDVRGGSYYGNLEFGAIPIDMTIHCVDSFGQPSTDHTLVLIPLNLAFSGSVDDRDRLRDFNYVNVLEKISIKAAWAFFAIR